MAPSPSAPTRARTLASRQSSSMPSTEILPAGMPAQRLPPPAERAGSSGDAGRADPPPAGPVATVGPGSGGFEVAGLGALEPQPSAAAQQSPIHFIDENVPPLVSTRQSPSVL